MERLSEEIEGTAQPYNYDPLLAMNSMIFGEAIKLGGLYLLNGDYCPVCEVIRQYADTEDEDGKFITAEDVRSYWIDGPADAVLEYCQKIT